MARPPTVSRILVFGGTGQGKSSLINVLTDSERAAVSDRADGETFKTTPYSVKREGCNYTFLDTVGLGEFDGAGARVEGKAAFSHLWKLLMDKEGFNLAIMVQRGRLTEAQFRNNYDVFVGLICKEAGIPVILAKTGLESRWNPETWLTEDTNAEVLRSSYPGFKKVVCGTGATAVDHIDLEKVYRKARAKTHLDLWAAIEEYQLEAATKRCDGSTVIKVWNGFCGFLAMLDFSRGQYWKSLCFSMAFLQKKAQEILQRIGFSQADAKEYAAAYRSAGQAS